VPAAEAAAAISPDAVLSRGVLLPVLSGVTRIAVAVSGGSDSMALLRLAALLPDGPEVIALTIDHGLRDGSRAEADQVARWCAGLGIPHHILAWAGAKPATGIQAKAREARYDLLTRWCTAHCVSVLLTAHTLDDQAETVLMRKRRTASAASLAAIWPERPWNGVRLLRPLLAVRREALRNFLRGLGQGWLEDPSNENTVFERARVRQLLVGENVAALAAEAAWAQVVTTATAAEAEAWLVRHVRIHTEGYASLPRAALALAGEGAALAALSRLVAMCGNGRAPLRADMVRLLSVLNSGGNTRRSLGGALVAARLRDVLIGREPGRIVPGLQTISGDAGIVWDGRFLIHAPAGATVRLAGGLRPPSPTGLPAFIVASLPVVMVGGTAVFPHFDGQGRVSVTLGERFGL